MLSRKLPQDVFGVDTAFGKTVRCQEMLRKTLSRWLLCQGSVRRNHHGITHDQRAMDRGQPKLPKSSLSKIAAAGTNEIFFRVFRSVHHRGL
jgi:hypothetical protein